MAYEALNNATRLEKNFIIVLNDNNMSISENVGGYVKSSEQTSDQQKRYHDLKEGVMNSLVKDSGIWRVDGRAGTQGKERHQTA